MIATLRWMLFAAVALHAGTAAACVDFRGIKVTEVADYNLRDAAVADVLPNGQPIILYQPRLKASISEQTKWFIYAHECAHHVLAHTTEDAHAVNEQEADCWAINLLYKIGILSERDIKIVQAELAATGRADATHLSGAERARNLESCLVPNRRAELLAMAARQTD